MRHGTRSASEDELCYQFFDRSLRAQPVSFEKPSRRGPESASKSRESGICVCLAVRRETKNQ